MSDSNQWPDEFPEAWASEWGEDEYGLWMAFTYKGVRHAFRWIQPGSFLMGSPKDEPERGSLGADETQHEVELTQGLWLGECAVTQALWEAVMGDNPSHFKGQERPVDRVSWSDVQRFIEALNGDESTLALCLPSEAQWEYACRAGTTTPFWYGDRITTAQVNYDGNYPYPGGEKGEYRKKTVWEWRQDWCDRHPGGAVRDPEGPVQGDNRVRRGGAWVNDGRYCRSAYCLHNAPDDRWDFTEGGGFLVPPLPRRDASGGAPRPGRVRGAERLCPSFPSWGLRPGFVGAVFNRD